MTTGLANIARPYAIAAFEHARDKKELAAWKTFLEAGSALSQDRAVKALLANPEVLTAQQLQFYFDILQPFLNEARKNFLRTLAEHKRFIALPEIFSLFNAYYDAAEKTAEVQITTAVPMSTPIQQKMTEALVKRLGQKIELHCNVDPALVGGAIIRMGDNVIDGSVKGKLTRLLAVTVD